MLVSRGARRFIAPRYIGAELLRVFLAVFALVLAVGLGGRFLGYLQEAATGRFGAEALWLLVALRVPEFAQVTVPFALYLALVLVFGRLHAEREFVALVCGGVSPGRFVRWLLVWTLPFAVLVGALSFQATPEARRQYAELSFEQLLDSEVRAVVPGAFHVYGGGRRVTYAGAVDAESNRLDDVFMAERQAGGEVTVWAESGRLLRHPTTGSRFLELSDGTRYEGRAGEPGYRAVSFSRLGQRVQREQVVRRLDERSTATWRLDLALPREAAELHWRIAMPLMTVIVSFLAFGISRPRPRAGRFARIAPAVGLFVAYYLLLVFAQDAVAEGLLPAAVGLWPIHALVLSAALALARRAMRPRG